MKALLPYLFATTTVLADPIQEGNFNSTFPNPLLDPWKQNGSGTLPFRDTNDFVSAPLSMRVTGRLTATDGVLQTTGLLGRLTSGATYVTRFQIKLDAPAQVRCLVYVASSIGQTPLILAERVVRGTEVGQWITVEGVQQVAWTGTPAGARIYFAVEQFYPGTTPTSAFPSYWLDDVTMELDDDGDGRTNGEEATAGTNPNSKDTDLDTMNDTWERVHFLNPSDGADADADADHDGHTNKIEYWANTDPQDANSYPGIPTNLQSSHATQSLLYMLQTRGARTTGKRLTGQQAHDIPNNDDYNLYVVGLHDKMVTAGFDTWVSLIGITAEGPTAAQPLQIQASAAVGRSYMDAGGLCVLHWTPRNPFTNGPNSDRTNVDIASLITPGTTANTRFTGWMDTVAAELALFGDNRPVIFRPLSEQNGNWNWYGRLQQDDFITLYKWLRSYFAVTKGLTNIIWTLEAHIGAHRPAGVGSAGISMDYYWPGDDVVDLVGFSSYVHDWVPGFDADTISRLHPKAFAITEGGPPSNEDDVPNNYNSIYLNALDAYYPRSAFFVVWNSFTGGSFLSIKDNPNYIALLNDTRVTNREALHYLAPTNLAASAASTSQLALNWSGTTGATSYRIEDSSNGLSPWSQAVTSATTNATFGAFAPATTRSVRVRAIYPDGDSAPLSFTTGTTFTPVQGWSQTHLGNPNAVLTGDADHDGVIDELEYALGSNPQAPTNQAFSMVQANPGSPLSLTFTRNLTATDATFIIEGSSDLLDWQPLATATAGGAWTSVAGTNVSQDVSGVVTFTDNVSPGSTPRRFLRLSVSVP